MLGYIEQIADSTKTRDAYVHGIKNYIHCAYQEQKKTRTEYISEIQANPEKYRTDLRNMLGFPLNCKDAMAKKAKYSTKTLYEDEEKTICRVTVTVLDCIPFSGVLILHNDGKEHPLSIVQHGGGGTPEICCGLLEGGSGIYNHMAERVFHHGANVFAPQLLLWAGDFETENFHRADRNPIDAQLRQLGGSITALEIYCYIKSLDAFCEMGIAQEDHLGMIGFSYGGLYTLLTAAVEPRIKAALSCSYFNQRENYVWVDWAWFEAAGKFLDAEFAMLIYPRCLRIAVGESDGMFNCKLAETEFARLRQLSDEIYGRTDWFDTCVYPGIHEFIKSDEFIKKVIEEMAK